MSARPLCLWLTGLPSAGKSSIANALRARLPGLGRPCYVLDGDVLRTGLNRDLGFTSADRDENIRRTAAVAALLVDAGLTVICALISPRAAHRALARASLPAGCFVEIFLDAPAAVCEARDPKGNYARARCGTLPGFTGTDGSYERPQAPDLHLNTATSSIEHCTAQILAEVARRGG